MEANLQLTFSSPFFTHSYSLHISLLLIDAGADPTMFDSDGMTVLHYSIRNVSMIQKLLEVPLKFQGSSVRQ